MVLIVIGALLLIIAALAAWLGLSALKAKNEVEAAIQAASRIQSQVQAGDTDKAQASIEAFSQHYPTLRMRRPSSRYGNWPHWCLLRF